MANQLKGDGSTVLGGQRMHPYARIPAFVSAVMNGNAASRQAHEKLQGSSISVGNGKTAVTASMSGQIPWSILMQPHKQLHPSMKVNMPGMGHDTHHSYMGMPQGRVPLRSISNCTFDSGGVCHTCNSIKMMPYYMTAMSQQQQQRNSAVVSRLAANTSIRNKSSSSNSLVNCTSLSISSENKTNQPP